MNIRRLNAEIETLWHSFLERLGLADKPKAKTSAPTKAMGSSHTVASRPRDYGYAKIGEGNPDMLNLVPLELPSGLTVYVTPVPMYRMHRGVPVHIPMSAYEQSAYGKQRKLLCITDMVLDTIMAKGNYVRPQTSFYDPTGDMQSVGLVIKKGFLLHQAKANAGFSDTSFSANDSKAWILSNANRNDPTKGVNHGYWMSPGDKLPIQKYGIAHDWNYTDIAQDGWFMSEDTSQGDARGILQGPNFKLITNESEPIWRIYYE